MHQNEKLLSCRHLMCCDRCNNYSAIERDVMIVYNNQQQLTRLCSFQEDFVLLQGPLRNNGNQGQQAIIRHQV